MIKFMVIIAFLASSCQAGVLFRHPVESSANIHYSYAIPSGRVSVSEIRRSAEYVVKPLNTSELSLESTTTVAATPTDESLQAMQVPSLVFERPDVMISHFFAPLMSSGIADAFGIILKGMRQEIQMFEMTVQSSKDSMSPKENKPEVLQKGDLKKPIPSEKTTRMVKVDEVGVKKVNGTVKENLATLESLDQTNVISSEIMNATVSKAKDMPNEEAKDMPNEEVKDMPNEEAKDMPNEEAKDMPNEEAKDMPNEEAEDMPNEEAKGMPNEESKDSKETATLSSVAEEKKSEEPVHVVTDVPEVELKEESAIANEDVKMDVDARNQTEVEESVQETATDSMMSTMSEVTQLPADMEGKVLDKREGKIEEEDEVKEMITEGMSSMEQVTSLPSESATKIDANLLGNTERKEEISVTTETMKESVTAVSEDMSTKDELAEAIEKNEGAEKESELKETTIEGLPAMLETVTEKVEEMATMSAEGKLLEKREGKEEEEMKEIAESKTVEKDMLETNESNTDEKGILEYNESNTEGVLKGSMAKIAESDVMASDNGTTLKTELPQRNEPMKLEVTTMKMEKITEGIFADTGLEIKVAEKMTTSSQQAEMETTVRTIAME